MKTVLKGMNRVYEGHAVAASVDRHASRLNDGKRGKKSARGRGMGGCEGVTSLIRSQLSCTGGRGTGDAKEKTVLMDE
jgi:hypothetical protein